MVISTHFQTFIGRAYIVSARTNDPNELNASLVLVLPAHSAVIIYIYIYIYTHVISSFKVEERQTT